MRMQFPPPRRHTIYGLAASIGLTLIAALLIATAITWAFGVALF